MNTKKHPLKGTVNCCVMACGDPKPYRKQKIPDFYVINPSFCNKVLLGNWFEDRQRYKKHRYCHETEYFDNYYPKKLPPRQNAEVWNFKIKGEGTDKKLLMNDGSCYFNNFTTSNTLHYNVYTRGLCGTQKSEEAVYGRKLHSIDSYGNQTEFGLSEMKYWQWFCQQYYQNQTTTFRNDYRPNKTEDLVTVHRTPPKHLETKTYRLNHELRDLSLRGKDLLLMKEPQVDVETLRTKMKQHGLSSFVL